MEANKVIRPVITKPTIVTGRIMTLDHASAIVAGLLEVRGIPVRTLAVLIIVAEEIRFLRLAHEDSRLLGQLHVQRARRALSRIGHGIDRS